MPIDLNEQLGGQVTVIAQQGVADNQQCAEVTLLSYQKDLFQGGQGESPGIMNSFRAADRTPVVKTSER